MESDLMRFLMKQATRLGARLFRQNTGQGWIGRSQRFDRPGMVEVKPGDVLVRSARAFHAGFEGLADLGGWTPVEVTAEMVGSTIAVYTQVEVKENGRVTPAQMTWISAVQRAGGRAGIARNEQDLRAILGGNPSA